MSQTQFFLIQTCWIIFHIYTTFCIFHNFYPTFQTNLNRQTRADSMTLDLISQFCFTLNPNSAYPKKKKKKRYLKICPKWWEKKMNRSTWIKRNLAKQFRETKRVAEFMRREYLPMETGNDVGRERKTSALWSRAVTGTIDAIRRVTRISFAFPVTETPVAQSVNWLRSVSPFLRRCFTKLSSAGRLFPDSVPGED